MYHTGSIEGWRLLEHENAQGCERSGQKKLSKVIVFLLGVCVIQSYIPKKSPRSLLILYKAQHDKYSQKASYFISFKLILEVKSKKEEI